MDIIELELSNVSPESTPNRIFPLRKGMSVVVSGRIVEAVSEGIKLEKCKLEGLK